MSTSPWLMGREENEVSQVLPEGFPFGAGPCGEFSGRQHFSLQPHWHPTEGKRSSGMASAPVPGDGSRNSALLPPQLGHPAPTCSSKGEDHTGLHWLQWARSLMPSGLQEVVSWAALGQNVSLDKPPAQTLLPTLSPSDRADYGHTGLGNITSPAAKPRP